MGFMKEWIDYNTHDCWRCVVLRPKRCKEFQAIIQRLREHVPEEQRMGF